MEEFLPKYRQLANENVWYKILRPDEAIEYRTIGRFWTETQIHAKILPERLLIQDLLELRAGYREIGKLEFEQQMQMLRENYSFKPL